MKVKTHWILIFLVGLNVLAHFLPFERASVSPDDLAHQVRGNRLSYGDIFRQTLRQPDRPVAFLFIMLQGKLSNSDPFIGLLSMVVSTSVVLVIVFFLLRALLKDQWLATLGASFFILLPNKLEVYHNPVNVVIDLANALYLGSFLLMVHYLRLHRGSCYGWALVLYGIAIFTYEVGFFLPGILLTYCWLVDRTQLKRVLPFFALAAFYVTFKLTNVFGMGDPHALQSHQPNIFKGMP